jgi:hypothetical protein
MIRKAILFLVVCAAVAAQAQKSPQEKQLFDQLNHSRQEAGLPPLQWDERLAKAAREHTARMVGANELGHVLKSEASVADRIAEAGVHFDRSGENVGYDTDFNDLHQSWMNSPPHRENILSPNYNMVGIGVGRTDSGLWYGTQDFAHGIPQLTAAQAEDAVAQSFEAMRKKEGRPPLERTSDAQVKAVACRMAKTGRLDTQAALQVPGVEGAVVYNNSIPSDLPDAARTPARSRRYEKFAVGACFANSAPGNPGGTYFVAIAFY